MDEQKIEQIKIFLKDFFGAMAVTEVAFEVIIEAPSNERGVVVILVQAKDPQFLIGQNGQTLLDLQRILRILLSKRLQTPLYVRLDINNYQKEKTEYLVSLAQNLANEVAVTKERRFLPPMPAHERRVVHEALSKREDVATQSQGDDKDRGVVIVPK